MNREIIYRGKRCDNGEWVYGYYVESHHSWKGHKPHKSWIVGSPITNGGWFNLLQRYAVKDDTVGQYTGQNAACKDAQGQICREQQVFEHDILADQNGEIIGCVKFTDERGWMAGVESLYDYTDRYDEKEALIIGNIYDNPELLSNNKK